MFRKKSLNLQAANKNSDNMRRKLFLTAMMLTLALTMMAQITNSAMSGKVSMTDTKEEVIGATVQAVHDPSGTKYAAITNVDGRFNIQGMRNGGPYTVTISYIGYETKTYKDIYLQLGVVGLLWFIVFLSSLFIRHPDGFSKRDLNMQLFLILLIGINLFYIESLRDLTFCIVVYALVAGSWLPDGKAAPVGDASLNQ